MAKAYFHKKYCSQNTPNKCCQNYWSSQPQIGKTKKGIFSYCLVPSPSIFSNYRFRLVGTQTDKWIYRLLLVGTPTDKWKCIAKKVSSFFILLRFNNRPIEKQMSKSCGIWRAVFFIQMPKASRHSVGTEPKIRRTNAAKTTEVHSPKLVKLKKYPFLLLSVFTKQTFWV